MDGWKTLDFPGKTKNKNKVINVDKRDSKTVLPIAATYVCLRPKNVGKCI